METTEDKRLVDNYLKLLNMRLLSLLENCPQENRGAVKDIMLSIIEDRPPDGGLDEEETAVAVRLVDYFNETRETLLKEMDEGGISPRMELLRNRFDLDADELILLTAVLAPYMDDRFRFIYSLFQNGPDPRMDFLLRLPDISEKGAYSYFDLLGPSGRLVSCSLIESVGDNGNPGPKTAFRPAPGLLPWLDGTRSTDLFRGCAEWIDPGTEKDDAYSHYGPLANAIEMAEIGHEPVPMVSLFGPDAERLLDAAAEIGAIMGRPILKLDLHGVELQSADSVLRFALRDCMLNNGILALTGINSWIDSGSIFPAETGKLLERWQAPVVLLTNRSFMFSPYEIREKRLVLRMPVYGLSGSQRFQVWKNRLSDFPLDDDLNDASLRTLAGQFTLDSAQIRSAVQFGMGKAVTEDRMLSIADLYEGARMSSMHHLSDLAKKMESRYTLKDLVLPEKQAGEVDALIAMARNRSLVLDDMGVGKKLVSGRGISGLFTGVPGTGKTLAAQAIAGELGLEIYRVDLSTIISKYIGETEKNLERIFTEAQNSNVVLFFDEADSLFGRRSEVSDSHDRYANIEVGYLLQRIETYDGIVLMATNLGANLDEAFARRIHFIIDFPFPDEDIRLRLWQQLLPENIEKESEIDLRPFASAYKIAGGGIRNAVVWAIYESARNNRPLNRNDLLHGVEREYQKMGKVFISVR